MSAVTDPPQVTEQERRYLMARRQSLIIDLGALEELLGLERSIVPRRKREPADLREKFERATAGYRGLEPNGARCE